MYEAIVSQFLFSLELLTTKNQVKILNKSIQSYFIQSAKKRNKCKKRAKEYEKTDWLIKMWKCLIDIKKILFMERNLKTRGIQNMVTIQQHQDQGPGNANQANNSSKLSTIITKPCGVWHIVAIFDYYYLQ